MSALAKEAREKMKAKAKSLAGERDSKVDSSDWSPAEPLNADAKTGARPISKRQFKKGGKVAGKAAAARADRKPRKAGGRVEKTEAAQEAKALVNRNVRAANEEREGTKHVGGFNKGGKAKRASGGGVKDKKALGAIDPSPKRGAAQHYKKGGKAEGGGSFLQRTIGGGEQEKREREMRDVGKGQTSNYSQEDRGALNRMLKKDDSLPAPGEIMERSGKFQNYKKGGKIKRAAGGRMDDDYVGASSVTKNNKPVTRPKDIKDRSQREPRASDLYSSEQLKTLERGYKKGGSAEKWIGEAIKKPGSLRKALGAKKGENIPAKKLAAAAEKGGKLGKRARLAETLKRINRAEGGPVDIGAMKKAPKAKKGGKTDIYININAKPAGSMMDQPPQAPMIQGVPMPMGGPNNPPAGAPPAAMPMAMPPAPPAPAPMAPPAGAPRKRGGRVGKADGGQMGGGFKGSMPSGGFQGAPQGAQMNPQAQAMTQAVNSSMPVLRAAPAAGAASSGAPLTQQDAVRALMQQQMSPGFKGAQMGYGAQGGPFGQFLSQLGQQTRPNPVNTYPGPQAAAAATPSPLPAAQTVAQAAPVAAPIAPPDFRAANSFRPGVPVNIQGPGIRPTQNLQVRPGATAPVRSAPVAAPAAAAPAAAAPAAQPERSQADVAGDVARNVFLARAMGLMRKRGGRVK